MNVVIKQNYIGKSNGHDECCIAITSAFNSNIIISNNILIQDDLTRIHSYAIKIGGESYCEIENNVVVGNIELLNSLFRNNIYVTGNVTNSYGIIKNNLCNASQFITGDNKTNIEMSSVFVSGDSPDGYYHLKDNSPAKGFD
jgi:hypothetical protein